MLMKKYMLNLPDLPEKEDVEKWIILKPFDGKEIESDLMIRAAITMISNHYFDGSQGLKVDYYICFDDIPKEWRYTKEKS